MNDRHQLRLQHFETLKDRYQASHFPESSPSSLLYLILRKAELNLEINDYELDYLRLHQLFDTINIIELKQYQAEEHQRLSAELEELKLTYKLPQDINPDSWIFSLVCKLDSEYILTESELDRLASENLSETVSIARHMERFYRLKQKYKVGNYPDKYPDSILYAILQKLDVKEPLDDEEGCWLLDNKFADLFAIVEEQEQERQAEAEFAGLKAKYGVSYYADKSIDSPLYGILQKLEADQLITSDESKWLKQEGLAEIVSLLEERSRRKHFAALKQKYKATAYQETSPSSKLYAILQNLESDKIPSEEDVSYLQTKGLGETITIVQQKHFDLLCRKYRIIKPEFVPFYEIMGKLDKGERLDRELVADLIHAKLLSPHGEIAKAYYSLEASFYEQEYKRTGNKWNLVSAISEWRKADKLEPALNLTNLDLNRVPGDDLKAAILTNRGFVLRDLKQFSEATKCASQAIDLQPDNYQPWLLLSSIYRQMGDDEKEEEYLNEAIRLGADIDYDEMKRLVKNAKNAEEQQKLAKHILDKDPIRYGWAKAYLRD